MMYVRTGGANMGSMGLADRSKYGVNGSGGQADSEGSMLTASRYWDLGVGFVQAMLPAATTHNHATTATKRSSTECD